MTELWLSQNTIDISIHHIKQGIFDIYHHTWKTSVWCIYNERHVRFKTFNNRKNNE